MSDQQKALRAAQWAVRHAQQMEDAGKEDEAEDYWREAERQYANAGVDPDWFDHAELVGELDEQAPLMQTYWIYPTTAVELTYEPGDDEPAGVVVDVEDLGSIDP